MTRHQRPIDRFTYVLLVLALLTSGAAAAVKGSSGSCTSQNLAVNVIFAPNNGGGNLIYGDGASIYSSTDQFNGGTIYPGGVFNLCSGSDDLTLSLASPRFINVSFFQQVTSPAPGAPILYNNTYPMTFINLRDVYSLQTVGGTLNTCLDGTVVYSKSTTTRMRIENPATFTDNGGVCSKSTDSVAQAANSGGNTSLIVVTHPDSCTWVATPIVDSFGYYRVGMAATVNRATVSDGQYNLPFAIKMVLASCPL